jgi:hypothetical protein
MASRPPSITGRFSDYARILLIAIVFVSAPAVARADAGIPMLVLAYPVLLYLLALVVLIEAVYLWWKLRTRWWRTIAQVSLANGLTMLLGYPLMWLIYAILEISLFWVIDRSHLHLIENLPDTMATRIVGIILSAAWLGPVEHAYWPILLAFVVLLIPSFFLSAFVEAHLLDQSGWLNSEKDVGRSVWRANILSYAVLTIFGCVVLYRRIKPH